MNKDKTNVNIGDVSETEEYRQWIAGKTKRTKYYYKSWLQKFCDFYNKAPSDLIREAREQEPETDKPWLEMNLADRRLQEWYVHLTASEENGGEGIAKTTAQTGWRVIKAFYGKFGVDVTLDTPKAPHRMNDQPEFRAADVREMVFAARTPRDQAIILCAFQGGMDPTEICRLDYGQVREAVEDSKWPFLISKIRKKTQVKHEAPLFKDAVRALKRYIDKRTRQHGEPSDDDPLFLKKNGERISPKNIRAIMRNVRGTIAPKQVPEADKVKSGDFNPFAPKYLRKAFGIACMDAEIPYVYKEYWMGHTEPYHGAYSGQITRKKQLENLEKLEPFVSISVTQEEMDEKERKQDERISQLEKEKAELRKQLKLLWKMIFAANKRWSRSLEYERKLHDWITKSLKGEGPRAKKLPDPPAKISKESILEHITDEETRKEVEKTFEGLEE